MGSLKINQSEHQIAQESIKFVLSEDNGGVLMFWIIIIIGFVYRGGKQVLKLPFTLINDFD
jgi:hypothetical protein